MNSIAKSVVTNKFSSVGKSLGFDDKDDNQEVEGASAKELRKIEEENAAARAKRQKEHDKRNAEREKKREQIRAKYGLKEGQEKSNRSGSITRKPTERSDIDTNGKAEGDDKQCTVM
ncbi:uncharacterized protein LOC144644760 [Oculina patagonica]